MPSPDHTKKLLHTYLRRLTNLSGNNRSIFLPRLVGDQFVDIQELSQLNGEKAFGIVEAMIAERQKNICPVLDARMEAANEASSKLKKLHRIYQFIFDERGSQDLHVGWPFVQGKFSDGTLVRCPLLFFPVSLLSVGNQWILHPRKEAGITFNKSFLLAYSYYNKVKANELLLDETFEDCDRESTGFRTWLYQLLQKSGLEIHFNPDNYRDELTTFANLRKEEFEDGLKNGELKLFPKAVLGIFPQAGSYLVPDYMHLIEESNLEDLEEFFHHRTAELPMPPSHSFHQSVKEEKMFTVFAQDTWQENALKAAKLGHSLVVQGPPGTGKSQLICNLISDAMASGKRVLVVCQKRAALDVVYARMKAHHLSEYLGLVHDFKNDRKGIYEKLASQIEKVEEYKSKNISLDAIHLERQFLRTCHRMDAIIEELELYKSNFFDQTACGASIKELYLQSSPAAEAIAMKQEFNLFRFDTLSGFVRKLSAYSNNAVKFKAPDYPWKERRSFGAFSSGDLTSIAKAVDDVKKLFDTINGQLASKLNAKLDWEQCEELLEKEPAANEMKALLKSEKTYRYFQRMLVEQNEDTNSLWLSNLEKNMLSCFDEDGPETTTPTAQLGMLQKALYRTMKARRSLVGLVRWELFSKDKFLIKRTLVSNGIASNKKGYRLLEKKLDNRLNLEHNLSKLRLKSWFLDAPVSLVKKDFIHWFADLLFALNAKINFSEIRLLKNFIDPAGYSLREFIHNVDQLYSILRPIHEHKINWINYLTPLQIKLITRLPENSQALLHALKQDFDALCDFDSLEDSLTGDEKSIISRLHDHTQRWEEEKLKPLFLNSLRLAWIEHLETKHPELRMVSSGKISALENELRELHLEKQTISEDIVLLRAREKVIDDLKFNRLNNRVTYRDLLHQVTKKKSIWPIRKLMAGFEEEIFKLVPCWLASPESVSAIFPMADLFDLVIFDEASQCFAERGIPALYRGKQTIVAGDAMQLRPGDFYQSRWHEDDNENPDTEVDSLLELAGRYLMNVQLRGHYRSKSPELIDFSNRHFYKGNLKFLPDLHALNQATPALVYEKIEGRWENNTNKMEALHVAALIEQLLKENPSQEIGVVTFNALQQALVLDVVELAFSKSGRSIPENIFVKNIENVQGDERDVIIFSVGYAPDAKGNVHAQFGSLNVAGGENRLNVAVSRAREKIIVVTSLWPDQLNVEGTLNAGPKLLKSYLQFVLDASQGIQVKNTSVPSEKKSVHYLSEEIKKWALLKWPHHVLEENHFPYFDLTIKKAGHTVGAIFTDDNLYFQSLSAKADHALEPQLLEMKHWPSVRVHSRNFWQDSDKFFNEVSKFLSQ